MKNILLIVCLLTLLIACKDITVGYLFTDNAEYTPDTMIVKSVLDPDIDEDAHMIKYEIPWQSDVLEGVQGTFPITYSIRSVESPNITSEIEQQFSMVRRGVVQLPWNHTVPAGRYVINITVSNEGYTHHLDSMYTVVVK